MIKAARSIKHMSSKKTKKGKTTKTNTKAHKQRSQGKPPSNRGSKSPIAAAPKAKAAAASKPTPTGGSHEQRSSPAQMNVPHTRAGGVRKIERRSYIKPVKIMAGKCPLEPSEKSIKAIAGLVKAGNTPDVAARACGVTKHIFNRWVQQGVLEINHADYVPSTQSLYASLVLAIDAADAQDECTDIMLIGQRINGWQALGWKRERKSASRWGNKAEVRVGTMTETPLQMDTTDKTTSIDTAAEMLAVVESIGGMKALLGTEDETTVDSGADSTTITVTADQST